MWTTGGALVLAGLVQSADSFAPHTSLLRPGLMPTVPRTLAPLCNIHGPAGSCTSLAPYMMILSTLVRVYVCMYACIYVCM